tara:strand:+ start:3393 stop:4988 length:1596 start_codon:yes stop_codon:yes gene_type:complete
MGRLQLFIPRWISEQKRSPELRSISGTFEFCNKPHTTTDFDHFTFLAETHRLSEIGWEPDNVSRLWSYHLHYFDFMHDRSDWSDDEKRKIQYLMLRWIDQNPFGKGTGWEPYPTSLRIINWVKWHLTIEPFSGEICLSLWNQLRWLADRPEIHLLGNHLFVNAKAMIIGSIIFDGEESMHIQKKGLQILNEQLDEQFLNDGGHFERSPMYHAIAIEDLLDLYILREQFSMEFPSEKIKEKIKNGILWLSHMSYQTGEFPHFNDCAQGASPTLDQLLTVANHAGIDIPRQKNKMGICHLRDSGFVVVMSDPGKLIADTGDIGPDYQPGHAHAETLSFEFSLGAQRVIVNSGTSQYGLGPERLRQRSTAAHSTVEVNGMNSSDVWSGFRVGRRATVHNIQTEHPNIKSPITISASHDGYRHLSGKNIHHRRWELGEKTLTIHDKISGPFDTAVSRLYFHPDFDCQTNENGAILSHEKLGKVILTARSGDKVLPIAILESTYHPAFGVSRINSCAEISLTDKQEISIELNWTYH